MKTFEIKYQNYAITELPQDLKLMVKAAAEAATNAYAPYSGFCVGAVARLSDGTTISSSNQESVSFPTGLCAERVLLFSHFNKERDLSKKIDLIVISAYKQGENVDISPCGICRQSLVEAEARQSQNIAVMFLYEGRYMVVPSAKMLLPYSFNNI